MTWEWLESPRVLSDVEKGVGVFASSFPEWDSADGFENVVFNFGEKNSGVYGLVLDGRGLHKSVLHIDTVIVSSALNIRRVVREQAGYASYADFQSIGRHAVDRIPKISEELLDVEDAQDIQVMATGLFYDRFLRSAFRRSFEYDKLTELIEIASRLQPKYRVFPGPIFCKL